MFGIVATAFAAAVAMPSCTDDTFDMPDYTISGEDVTISVPIHLPKMDNKTRASFENTTDLNRVESLWVRTYSADTGEATSEWIIVENLPTIDTERPHPVTINTKSGSSYIVGVANVNNLGISSDDINTQKPLSELLEAADTWSEFLKIAVVSPYSREQNGVNGNIFLPDAPLPMAGCFTNITVGGDHPGILPSNPADWQHRDFTPYFIPASKGNMTLSDGAIHLRRLVSHLTFNIIEGGNDAFDLTVNSYQIMNAPKYSWLYERPEEQGSANFGDKATEDTVDDFYYDVPQFGSNYPQAGTITDNNGNTKKCITFDYWQSENKHTGTSTEYKQRDAFTGTGDDKLFTSLTGNTWTNNNEATYLLISCTLDYKNQIVVGNKGEQPPTDGSHNVYRTAQATYLVHLGYVGDGSEAEKSKDFNCFRNVNYTYNITVNGVNDIRVDAWREDEFPGEEGMVSDLQYATIDLDAHYHAFNIQLTQQDLSDPNFGFIINTYDNGRQITITDENRYDNNNIYDSNGVIDPKYYKWIELRATTNEATLAEYKPHTYTNYTNGEKHTFLLSDIRGKGMEGGPWSNGTMSDDMKSSSGWYTVFVNEYTYEDSSNESSTSGNPNWMGYVNQNPRRAYIRVTKSSSSDGNSVYARSKYGLSQNSIQTYYSLLTPTPVNGDIPRGTAIGMERVNESEGMNMRDGFHSWDNNGSNGQLSESNGRWNVALGLDNKTTGTPTINNSSVNNRPLWSKFINQKPLEIPEVAEDRLQGGSPLPARTIASGNPVKLPGYVLYTASGSGYTFSDPQPSNDYTIQSIYACMNRNRDNNGNGRIDPDELRWYVPAMGKYLRLLIGAPSLSPNKLMDYESVSRLPVYGNGAFNGTYKQPSNNQDDIVKNDYISRYMYYSSEGKVLWAMEGMSTSTYYQAHDWGKNYTYPWQVRCIRNLGSNLSTITSGEKVTMAYEVQSNRTISMTYYDDASIRQNKYSGNGSAADGHMPIHFVTDEYNKLYRKFQYASRDIQVPDDDKTVTGLQEYINSNPCSTFGTEWRIPNQTEAAILRNIGGILQGNSSSWLTCTANYFNSFSGYGGTYVNGATFFLAMLANRGTLLTPANINDFTMYIRCVKDVD